MLRYYSRSFHFATLIGDCHFNEICRKFQLTLYESNLKGAKSLLNPVLVKNGVVNALGITVDSATFKETELPFLALNQFAGFIIFTYLSIECLQSIFKKDLVLYGNKFHFYFITLGK